MLFQDGTGAFDNFPMPDYYTSYAKKRLKGQYFNNVDHPVMHTLT